MTFYRLVIFHMKNCLNADKILVELFQLFELIFDRFLDKVNLISIFKSKFNLFQH